MPDETLHSALDGLSKERLLEIILRQGQTITELRTQIEELQKANEHLRDRLEQTEREAKRQAAPFRRNKGTTEPKEPGRKGGHQGQARPQPDSIDHYVEVPLVTCPQCGGSDLEAIRPIKQLIEELPAPLVEVTELTTYRGQCAHCGTVETSHPLKSTSATGAAGVHLGPRLQALATSLVYEQGLTLRSACGVLKRLLGLRLSPGGLQQIAHRAAARLEPEHAALLRQGRKAAVQYVDETSWYVAGEDEARSWLWVFATEQQTIYRIDHRRSRAVVTEMLGKGFQGVLVSDCLNIYDDLFEHQQKCYAHHLKAISGAEIEYEAFKGKPSAYLRRVRVLLKAAMALKQAIVSEAARAASRSALEATADRLLLGHRADPLEEKVATRLRKQRRCLFTFLDHQRVDATNNLAERRLRPAVIRRKLSCGNRTRGGARTWEVLASLAATYVQQGLSFVKLVMESASFEAQLDTGR